MALNQSPNVDSKGNSGPAISVSQLKTADHLANKRKELELLRIDDRREWALNFAFYKGDQWVFWNKVSSQVETLPVQDADKPRWKVRLTNNQVLPGVQHYVALLTKNKPVITASPDSSSYRDLSAAQVAESLYEYWWQDMRLRSKLQSALTYACISQGYWKLSWDALAGKSMTFTLDPNGQPITDDNLADVFRDELKKAAEQGGQNPEEVMSHFEKTVYVGDIRVDVMPGENVIVDPSAKCVEDAAYAICKHPMDVDEIYARWKVKVQPDCTPSEGNIPLAYTRHKDERPKTLRDVYIGYFKPSPVLKKGRYVVWIESPNQILDDTPWPYPFSELPLIKFPGFERPGSNTDEAIVTHVRPLQKELNRTLSQIVQFKDLTIKPQIMAPVGSLRQKLTDEPGAVFEYQPVQGLMPDWRPMPALPQATFLTLADIQQRLDKAFNRIPSQRDQLPARSDSGYQLELIQEAVADQMSPVINRLEESLARAGKLMILLAKQYYIEPRILKIRGQGGSIQVKKFMNADLAGGFSFVAETGSGLPRSRAGRQQQILNLVEARVIEPQAAMKYLDLADLKGIQAQFMADEDQAYREHEKLIRGEPISMVALQQALPQIEQGVQAGKIPPDQVEQIIQQTALQPLSFENSPTHLEVHGLFMKSPEYEHLPPEAQTRFAQHYDATYQRIMQMQITQASLDPRVAPRVAINAHSTTSASVMGEALRRVGVNVTDEQAAEQPLETMVVDSVDKPDMDSAGNDPLDDAERELAIQTIQMQNAQKQAKATHDMTLANHQAHLSQQQHEADQQRQSELHQARLDQMRQSRQAAQRKAK